MNQSDRDAFLDDLAQLEAEAIDHVALTARLHAERLPASSRWQSYFAELASALAEDASGLRLVSSERSAP